MTFQIIGQGLDSPYRVLQFHQQAIEIVDHGRPFTEQVAGLGKGGLSLGQRFLGLIEQNVDFGQRSVVERGAHFTEFRKTLIDIADGTLQALRSDGLGHLAGGLANILERILQRQLVETIQYTPGRGGDFAHRIGNGRQHGIESSVRISWCFASG